jgi:hypothetical protein
MEQADAKLLGYVGLLLCTQSSQSVLEIVHSVVTQCLPEYRFHKCSGVKPGYLEQTVTLFCTFLKLYSLPLTFNLYHLRLTRSSPSSKTEVLRSISWTSRWRKFLLVA